MVTGFDPIEPISFRRSNEREFNEYLLKQENRFPSEECLKIDLHCHDHNSDIPDELWGRIMRLPETWLKTNKLYKTLKTNEMDIVTITNHNNARSCWDLIDQGEDVLVGAEFTCYFPEFELYVHVLTYGFTKEQEKRLNLCRQNIYDFLRYAAAINVPVILPHPLYFYTKNEKLDLTLFEKFAVLFQRFEVLNGQRDLWQSLLTLNWTLGLTADKIHEYARKHDLNPEDFGVDPYKAKILTGGSDDHTGIFAGGCGSSLYIKNLQNRLKTEKASDLALEAIREGNIAPFGTVGENQRLTIALLDYFAQVVNRVSDPGLLRIILHRGTIRDKIGCFILSNLLLEMKKHKKTIAFFDFVHGALHGKKMTKLTKWKVSKDYRFCIKYLENIAESKHRSPADFVETVNQSIRELFTHLNKLIVRRIKDTLEHSDNLEFQNLSTEEFTRKFEIPSQLTALFFDNGDKNKNFSNLKVQKILDSLTFPVLISMTLAGSSLAATRVLYQNRTVLNDFADYIGHNKHQKRALHLTDTLYDQNGVSSSLSGKLLEAQCHKLPIDYLVCHDEAVSAPHLHVVKPIASVNLDLFGGQPVRVPDLMEIAQIFYEGGYDRVICSTEGPMAAVALFLTQKFNIKSFFFMHTDWISFIKNTTNLNQHERDRVRRILRALYNEFDGIFVLNSEHRSWLTGHEMLLDKTKVFQTAHHAQPRNEKAPHIIKSDLIPGATSETPVLFIACRISREKGVMELPEIIGMARTKIPDLKIVIAGSGPSTEELKKAMPDAIFTGWVSKERLASLYKSLDLFIFPSKFDTFGNVILEAYVHEMPVVAYNCKGPKDIIDHNKNGYLVETKEEMAQKIIDFFGSPALREKMRKNTVIRAAEYEEKTIMTKFLMDMGLELPEDYNPMRLVAE